MQRFFTIIMSAEFPEHRDPSVTIDHIRGVCRPFGVEVNLKDPKVETLQELPNEGTEKYFLTAEGEDKPGIIRHISAARAGGNRHHRRLCPASRQRQDVRDGDGARSAPVVSTP